jgi:lactate permease
MFTQILDPTGNLFTTWIVALIPVVALLILLAGFRIPAWLATLIGSVITFLLGLWVWRMPLGDGIRAYLYGSATGIWNVDWITFWGVMLFNTLVTTSALDKFRRWLTRREPRTFASRRSYSRGPSARCWKDWSGLAIPGLSLRRS